MKAREYIKKYANQEQKENLGLIAISKGNKDMFWYHVHLDEEVPDLNKYDLAIHIRFGDEDGN